MARTKKTSGPPREAELEGEHPIMQATPDTMSNSARPNLDYIGRHRRLSCWQCDWTEGGWSATGKDGGDAEIVEEEEDGREAHTSHVTGNNTAPARQGGQQRQKRMAQQKGKKSGTNRVHRRGKASRTASKARMGAQRQPAEQGQKNNKKPKGTKS